MAQMTHQLHRECCFWQHLLHAICYKSLTTVYMYYIYPSRMYYTIRQHDNVPNWSIAYILGYSYLCSSLRNDCCKESMQGLFSLQFYWLRKHTKALPLVTERYVALSSNKQTTNLWQCTSVGYQRSCSLNREVTC